MSFQRLQDTDAFILIEFRRATAHLRKHPLTQEVKMQIGVLALPYFNRLLSNGHSRPAAARLLQDTVTDTVAA
jgi:hypothetical protein